MIPITLMQVVTAIALAATLLARRSVGAAALRSSAAARIRTVCTLVAILLALRLLDPILATPLFSVLVLLTAAWLPFAGLRMVEELSRRHAPRWAKLAALGGALAFTAFALTVGALWSTAAMIALALWQSAMLIVMVWLLLRDRRELSGAERQACDTFLVALLLTIPLAATDFQAYLPDAPVRGGPFAVLVLMLAVSRLGAGEGTPNRLFGDLAISAGAAALCGLVGVAAIPNLPADRIAQIVAGGAAVAALLLLVDRLVAARARHSSLVASLALAPDRDADAIIASHPLLASGRMVTGDDLSAYPVASVARLLEHRVTSAETGDDDIRAAARDLLEATTASHLLRISRDPPAFLAVAASDLAGPALDAELTVAARLIEKAA